MLTCENENFEVQSYTFYGYFMMCITYRSCNNNNMHVTRSYCKQNNKQYLSVLQENTESVLSLMTSTYRTRRTSCSCHQQWVTRTNLKWRNSRRPESKPITQLNSLFARTVLSVNSMRRYTHTYHFIKYICSLQGGREIEIKTNTGGEGNSMHFELFSRLRDACPNSYYSCFRTVFRIFKKKF